MAKEGGGRKFVKEGRLRKEGEGRKEGKGRKEGG